jgi:hypothetical protein
VVDSRHAQEEACQEEISEEELYSLEEGRPREEANSTKKNSAFQVSA